MPETTKAIAAIRKKLVPSIAQRVHALVKDHYLNKEIKFSELVDHLRNNKVDNAVFTSAYLQVDSTHRGFLAPMSERFPIVFYYADNSMLVVGPNCIHAVHE